MEIKRYVESLDPSISIWDLGGDEANEAFDKISRTISPFLRYPHAGFALQIDGSSSLEALSLASGVTTKHILELCSWDKQRYELATRSGQGDDPIGKVRCLYKRDAYPGLRQELLDSKLQHEDVDFVPEQLIREAKQYENRTSKQRRKDRHWYLANGM